MKRKSASFLFLLTQLILQWNWTFIASLPLEPTQINKDQNVVQFNPGTVAGAGTPFSVQFPTPQVMIVNFLSPPSLNSEMLTTTTKCTTTTNSTTTVTTCTVTSSKAAEKVTSLPPTIDPTSQPLGSTGSNSDMATEVGTTPGTETVPQETTSGEVDDKTVEYGTGTTNESSPQEETTTAKIKNLAVTTPETAVGTIAVEETTPGPPLPDQEAPVDTAARSLDDKTSGPVDGTTNSPILGEGVSSVTTQAPDTLTSAPTIYVETTEFIGTTDEKDAVVTTDQAVPSTTAKTEENPPIGTTIPGSTMETSSPSSGSQPEVDHVDSTSVVPPSSSSETTEQIVPLPESSTPTDFGGSTTAPPMEMTTIKKRAAVPKTGPKNLGTTKKPAAVPIPTKSKVPVSPGAPRKTVQVPPASTKKSVTGTKKNLALTPKPLSKKLVGTKNPNGPLTKTGGVKSNASYKPKPTPKAGLKATNKVAAATIKPGVKMVTTKVTTAIPNLPLALPKTAAV